MKPRSLCLFPRTLVVCVAPLLACASARASVASSNESQGTNSWTLPAGTNLLAGATVTTSTPLVAREITGTNPGVLTDGAFGSAVSFGNGTSITYALNLAGHPTGYDVTAFDSYCAWGDSGRDNQNYMLQYSTVANPGTFTTISTVENRTTSDSATHTRLTNDTGFLATGVHSIRIIFDRQENTWVGYREFVLRDTPVVVCVSNVGRDDNTWPALVGPNLINGATAISVPNPPVSDHGNGDVTSATWTTVTDGVLGTPDTAGNLQSVAPTNGQVVTFPLDLVAKPGGYTITSFESYCAWGNNARDDQRYLLEYSVVGSPGVFVPITDVFNRTEFNNGNSRKSTRTRVTGNGAPMATGVAAIRLTFTNQENGYTGFREFVLRDTPLPINIVHESSNTHNWTLPTGSNLLSTVTAIDPPFPANPTHGGDVTSGGWSTLTDGSIGSAGVQLTAVAPDNGTSVTYTLDTSINFNGYKLNSLDTYCAWQDSGRDDQNYTVSYATVDAPSVFLPIETISNKTYTPGSSTHTRLTSPLGALANRVGAIKFNFALQENTYTGFREFVALGSAVPLSPPLTWTGLEGNGIWSTVQDSTQDNNWKLTESGAPAYFNSLAPLIFDSTGSSRTISIPSALTAVDVTFSNDNATPYAFSGQTLSVTNGLTMAGSGSVAFNNPVNSTGVVVSGGGSLTLAEENVLTGSTIVSNGALNLADDYALGVSSLSVSGGVVNFTSADPNISSISGTGGALVLGNSVSAADTTLQVGNSVSTTYGGTISDASASANGSLVKSGSGSLTLTGASSYSGTTTVNEGELRFGQRQSLYNGVPAAWNATNLSVLDSAKVTLKVGGAGEFTSSDIAALDAGGFAPNSILGLDTSSGNTTIASIIGGGEKLQKSGVNILTLSGANTFSNGITITQGVLALANPVGPAVASNVTVCNRTFDAYLNMQANNQFGPNAILKFDTGPSGAVHGWVNLRGTEQTIAGLESPSDNLIVYLQNDDTAAPGYSSFPGTCKLTINTAADTIHTFRGNIRNRDGGALSLVKTGLGTQELVNSTLESYSYTGPTSVNAGTLRINFAGGNNDFGSNITVANGATLAFNAVGGEYNFNREIHGPGHVTAKGANAIRFTSPNNSFSGGLTIGSPEINSDNGFVAFAAQIGVVQGAGNGPGQTCIGGAMTPTNVITIQGGATLALDGIGPLGESTVLPQYAPSIVVNNSGLRGGGLAFVPNLTLNHAEVTVGNGIAIAGFDTSLCFVGTVTVGGDSNLPTTIKTPVSGPSANISLGSAALPGTTFNVTDVTVSEDVDLDVDAVIRNLNGLVSPLTKTGAGTMLLRKPNTYTGATTVSAGTLIVSGDSIADTNKLEINGTGKLGVVTAANETVKTLFIDGVQQIAGTYGSSTSAATFKNDTWFSGTGMVTVTRNPVVSYETWALVIPNVNDRDRTDDPDGDGFSNLDEFLFGTSPVASNGALSTVEATGSTLIVRWCERVDSSSVYLLQESTTLESPWPTSPVTPTNDPDTSGLYSNEYVRKQAVIPVNSVKKFVRVRATE